MVAAPTLSDRLRLAVPGMVALLLLLACVMPLQLSAWPLTPHVVWLMTLSIGALAPAAWPVALAFFLGLLSDFIMGTPLGAQALLALALTLITHRQARRAGHRLFRLRWLEAALTLLVFYFLLWLIIGWVVPLRPPLSQSMAGALFSALWFPLFYGLAVQLQKLLP